jgi:hypothetical protein
MNIDCNSSSLLPYGCFLLGRLASTKKISDQLRNLGTQHNINFYDTQGKFYRSRIRSVPAFALISGAQSGGNYANFVPDPVPTFIRPEQDSNQDLEPTGLPART